jgi:hypothetical protein
MRYRSIAFGGGGMKGAAHVGALRAILETQGSLDFPDGIYGFSVGSIVAVAVAFGVDEPSIRTIYAKYNKLSNFLPSPSVSHAWSLLDRKGFFSMDMLRKMLTDVYTEAGIEDIEHKCLCDAKQPLFIVASNMSTQRPTILTGKVPVLDAMMCSCCIPGLFEPQILYGDVYLDAGVYVRSLELVLPPHTLILSLSGKREKITPKSSLGDILRACYFGQKPPTVHENMCRFQNLPGGLISDITPEETEILYKEGYSQLLAFLTKRCAKESN